MTRQSTQTHQDRTAQAARKKRIAVYCRVSSDEGMGQPFTSIEAQRTACEAFIASRVSEGWELIPDRFDDPGFTGANLDRPAMQRLLDLVGRGEIDGIVVRALDRLSRSLRDVCKVNELLSAHDVFLASVTQSLDTGTPHGRLMLNMIVSFAECEREVTVERTKAKIAATRRQGIWRGGRPVLGYDHGPYGLVVNTAEAALVRSIFSAYLDLRSLGAVVGGVKARGVLNKSWTTKDGRALGGQPFSKSTLSQLLSNVLYAGLVPHKGATYPGKHTAIIAPDVFQRVQQLLASNNRAGTGLGTQHRHAAGLLKGLLACGCCGRPMQYTTAKGDRGITYRYVRCVTHSCPTKAVPAGEIEAFVLSKVRGTFTDGTLVTRVFDIVRAKANERVLDLEAQRDLLHDELRDAEPLLTHTNETVRTEAASRHAQATTTLASVEKAMTEACASLVDRATVEAGLREFDSLFACLSPTERTQLIGSVVERVAFDGVKGEIAITRRSAGTAGTTTTSKEDAA